MVRRMADDRFRHEQWQHRYARHIEPINRFVDELGQGSEERSVPYVAPMYGGINATLLSVLRDPGPKTQVAPKGSGFICMENDDPTAERLCNLFAQTGIDASEAVLWNAYPWYINRVPKAAELGAGLVPLKRIIELLPKLRVVMLHGKSARDSWNRFARRYPELLEKRALYVISTYHPSGQALQHPDPKVREAREEHLLSSFRAAADRLHGV